MNNMQKNHIFFTASLVVGLALVLSACRSAPKVTPLEDLDEWDLLWISDSSGWGVAEVYAGMVAEDTGKKINVNDQWSGTLPAGDIYQALTGQYDGPDMRIEKMPEYVAEAELIVFYANPEKSINPDRPGDDGCFQTVNAYVNDCDPETFAVYVEHLQTIYQRMMELREGQPTIIRAYDAYFPLIDVRKADGDSYEACKACWANYNAAIHQAAESMNIPVAPVAERWNGPNWNLDPSSDLGYTIDGQHPNVLGAQVTAQALRELGYDPVPTK